MSATKIDLPNPAEFFPGKPYWSAADLGKFFGISRAAAYRLPIRWTQLNGAKRASLDAIREYQRQAMGG